MGLFLLLIPASRAVPQKLEVASLDSSFGAVFEDAAEISLSAAVMAHLATPLAGRVYQDLSVVDHNALLRLYWALKLGVMAELLGRLINRE